MDQQFESMEASPILKLYGVADGFVAKIAIQSNTMDHHSVRTCVIMDRSGSMGPNVKRLVTQILPAVFVKLNYELTNKITLLTFDSFACRFDVEIKDMEKLNIESRGQTYMKQVIDLFAKYLVECPEMPVRLITISDGDLHDQIQTLETATKVMNTHGHQVVINSQAIRLFTSGQQPDTRGLASMLQFNNSSYVPTLKDISSGLPLDQIINEIVDLFRNDHLGSSSNLTTDIACMASHAWEPINQSTLKIFSGETILWFTQIPSLVQLNGVPIQYELSEKIDVNNVEPFLSPILTDIISRLKILKVVDQPESKAEIARIMNFAEKLSTWTEMIETTVDLQDLLNQRDLTNRLHYFKLLAAKKRKSYLMDLAQIANQDKVSQLSSAQQAEYLRNEQLGKNLARRALSYGLDFSDIIRTEVRQMRQHIDEIKDIDDSMHPQSFYSCETTLGGIRAVCALVDEGGLLEEMSVTDILQLINIVGVACHGPIGDYPDPMTWRVPRIFSNCFISVSDIMMAKVQSRAQGDLHPPGFPTETITNTIPIFPDTRILTFLKTHAPSILEYSASIGMRRVITGIPMTHSYTLCAGIVTLVEMINETKSTVDIETFISLVQTYSSSVGTHFDHILQYLTQDQPQELSFYIENNGYTNMMDPLYKLIQSGHHRSIPRILRSIYVFEVYQIIKKILKNSPSMTDDYLTKLLGIDYTLRGVTLTPPFEADPAPTFCDLAVVDHTCLKTFISAFSHADYIVLLPLMFKAMLGDHPVQQIKAIPKLTSELIIQEMGLSHPLEQYKFYATIQAMLFPNKRTRVGINHQMLISDVSVDGDHLIRETVSKFYRDDFNSKQAKKRATEKKLLVESLVHQLIQSQSIEEYIQLFINGIQSTQPVLTARITNTSSDGYVALKTGLLDTTNSCPHRISKLKILLLGQHNTTSVWNNGNKLIEDLSLFEEVFKAYNHQDMWQEILDIYKDHGIHTYRLSDKPNRHTHCNSKPSYWALGYGTLEEMIQCISHNAWLEYKEIHNECCGTCQY